MEFQEMQKRIQPLCDISRRTKISYFIGGAVIGAAAATTIGSLARKIRKKRSAKKMDRIIQALREDGLIQGESDSEE